MLGDEDRLIPVETGEYYCIVMTKIGLRCDLKIYDGQGHVFFNFKHEEMYLKPVEDTALFN
ncbi:MAG: acetyl esterase [Cyclobacteriaceae bacterium]|jgi:hypothetical protein